jgi:putative SOS response-associated peptidase YedK
VSSSPPEEIAEYFGATDVGATLAENYNVAPTQDIYVVYEDGQTRRVDAFHWGLVPGFAKDLKIGNRMINARAETVATNGSFKSSLARRRCIVPADGFYEWKAVPGRKSKQPYFIHRPDGEPYALAGLWAEWRGEVGGEPTVVRSTTIITTDANDEMSQLHDRMPVILPRSAWDTWLDPEVQDLARVSTLLVPAPNRLTTFHPVSTEVNNARNEGGRHLVDEVAPTDEVNPPDAAEQPAQGSLL